MSGFIKIMRNAEPLIQHDPNAYLILSQAAFRATWKTNSITGLEVGQAFIGFTDFPMMGRKQYRNACNRIVTYELAAIKTTNKGSVVSLEGWGFAEFGDSSGAIRRANEGPSGGHQGATNEEGKKVRRKEKSIPPTPLGVTDEVWHEYLKTRTRLKAPNSQRAIATLTNKIEKLSAEYNMSPNDLVEQANMNGWKSVYPPKEQTHGRNPSPRELAAVINSRSVGRTLFDASTDLRQPIREGRGEHHGHDRPLAISASDNIGRTDQEGGDDRS